MPCNITYIEYNGNCWPFKYFYFLKNLETTFSYATLKHVFETYSVLNNRILNNKEKLK